MGPTVTRPVKDPLAVTQLDNWLSISVLKLLLFCFFLSYLFFTLDHVIKIILFSFFIPFFSPYFCVSVFTLFPHHLCFSLTSKLSWREEYIIMGKLRRFWHSRHLRKKIKKKKFVKTGCDMWRCSIYPWMITPTQTMLS